MLAINIVDGGAFVRRQDIDRALAAAEKALAARDHRAAYAAYVAYVSAIQDADEERDPDGLAAVWAAAERAADIALTKGWVDPGGASLELVAW